MQTVPRSLKATAPIAAVLVIAAGLAVASPAAGADSAQSIYTQAMARERQIRDAANRASLIEMRRAVQTYERLVRRFPRSGYCDNALWQAGNLSLLAYERFGKAADRQAAIRLLQLLRRGYPSSSFVSRAADVLRDAENARREPAPARAEAAPSRAEPAPSRLEGAPATPPIPAVEAAPVGVVPPPPPAAAGEVRPVPAAEPPLTPGVVTIKDIRRTDLPDGVRVSIEMDGESLYRAERLENPRRVFFDLKGTRTTPSLQDATIRFGDDIVREVRLGRHPQNTTRVVMHLDAVETYSVFTLYNPFRLVVDFKRAGAAPAMAGTPLPAYAPGRAEPEDPARGPAAKAAVVPAAKEPVPPISRTSPPELISPQPTANANGQFSIARQLGLGVSRIVIDAGHGGHDPGARANGLNEADLVLDVAQRLKQLLEKQPGIEVTMTRDKDVFIPLEERTAIANRTGADLFLSIHANASRNTRARGIETYFLNFASNPEAEAVAARENAASGRTMHSLPEIVRAIALNNKIDESRDFADMVQKSMIRRLSARNSSVRDLGVKQAPFVVLIGAGMPSVLAEISFVTNKQEGALLKTTSYRQQIAESLQDAILRYQRSLKGVRAVARRE